MIRLGFVVGSVKDLIGFQTRRSKGLSLTASCDWLSDWRSDLQRD